jgi:ribonuclease P protein component
MKNSQLVSIKSSREIDKLIKNSKTISNSNYLIRFTHNDINKLRFVIAPSKKIFKTAVSRNKIKRQVRMFIINIENIKSVDILIIIKECYNKNTYLINNNSFIDLYNKIA